MTWLMTAGSAAARVRNHVRSYKPLPLNKTCSVARQVGCSLALRLRKFLLRFRGNRATGGSGLDRHRRGISAPGTERAETGHFPVEMAVLYCLMPAGHAG